MFRGKRVVVVMPAYNAAKTLVQTFNEVMEQGVVDTVIIVDDASPDETTRVAKTLPNAIVLTHPRNLGYGGNQKSCYRLALEQGADIVVMVHPDAQYTPKLIPAMVSLIANGLYPCVLGSRILGNYALRGGMPVWKYIANRFLTLAENILLGAKLSEYHTGYRAFSREILERTPLAENSNDFVFDNQMLAQILWFNYTIAEVSCPTRYFDEASSINFRRSVKYGFGCLGTAWQFPDGALGPGFLAALSQIHMKLCGALLLLALTAVLPERAPADDLYYLTREIPIGGAGSWDYLSIDSEARRLYVTHSTRVVVLNIDKEEVLGEITGTAGVHGFAIAPDLQRGFASDGRDGTVSVVDLRTLKTLSKSPTGENPDAIIYESGRKEVYAFNGRSHSVTVLAAATGTVMATTPLPGKPEFSAADPGAGRVFCNIEDKSEVVALDTTTHAVVNVWPIAPGKEASGLAIDAARHRLFIGCHNQKMAMMDATTGKILDTIPIANGVDACVFDPGTSLAFASCGDGSTTIAREEGDKLVLVQTLATKRGARTMALDPKTHKIYLAAAEFEAQDDDATKRPRMIPNTLKILVYSMGPAPTP